MDKTTLDLLKAIKGVADDYPRKRVLGEYFHLWREAGYPDLPKPAAPTLETCWTCGHNWQSAERDSYECDPADTDESVWEWACMNASGHPKAMPPRDYSGPPCPGWKAKE